MKIIKLSDVRDRIREAVQAANFELPDDVLSNLRSAAGRETSQAGREVFDQLLENARIAREEKIALCQDTGLSVFFIDVGEDVRWDKNGGPASLREAVEEGVREGYRDGYLRKSVVDDPVRRRNTGDNTPAFIHWNIIPGDAFRMTFLAKGAGAENMSALRMLAPADGIEGVENFVVETVDKAGPNPCPPVIVGVGIGGNFEGVALLAKKALLRTPLGAPHPDPIYADMERRLLRRINDLGIGPQGLGGRITALAVHVETSPCHIGALPAAVNLECHAHRVMALEW